MGCIQSVLVRQGGLMLSTGSLPAGNFDGNVAIETQAEHAAPMERKLVTRIVKVSRRPIPLLFSM